MTGETGAAKAPVEAQPEPAKKKFGWWELLNSQASLTLLLAIVGGVWSIYQYLETKQKDDAQFLGSMLPYLTDSKLETRVRAIQIIEGRYSPGPGAVDLDDIPANVKSLMCSSVGDFADLRHQISNQLIISADAVLEFCQHQANSAAATPTPQGNARPTPSPATAQTAAAHTRVYIQIYDEEQREGAEEVQQSLQKKGYVVPGIEDLSRTNPDLARKPVGNTEVRYFNPGDAAAANDIYDALSGKNAFPELNFAKLSKKRPAQSHVPANPGTVEIWFAPQDAMKQL